jgi:hypothetical protein
MTVARHKGQQQQQLTLQLWVYGSCSTQISSKLHPQSQQRQRKQPAAVPYSPMTLEKVLLFRILPSMNQLGELELDQTS